jgi:hypothetical protein
MAAVSLATEAAKANNYPLHFNKRECKLAESAKAYVDTAVAAITPSHVIKYAGTFTTAGGSATEAHTVTGAATGDVAIVTLNTAGGTPRTITTSKVSATNTLQVVFSGDPSTDHVVNYVIMRAVS